MPLGHPATDVATDTPMRARADVDRFRPDIQGLRAFAVLAVVADHVLGWPGGGFVGVDVFFVISGFLITGLLLREYERTGTISPRRFYVRRARRILPASLVVLVATVVAARVLFFAGRADAVTGDSTWAAVFLSNWHFAAQGTDYFQAGRAVSPVQHFWSLSVEEQFYFVWPWLMLAVLVWLARRRRGSSARRVAGALLVVVCVASLAWGWWATADNPTSAYFATWTRVWELGVGAALAAGLYRLARLGVRTRTALTWLGLLGLVASLVVIRPETRFPVPGAVLPVLAAAALIAAGVGGDGARVLRTRPAVYIGTISYSMYLWHFPLLVLGGAVWTARGPGWSLGVLAAIAVASVLSYHLVEKPVLQSPLLLPRDPAVPRADQWRAWWRAGLPTLRVAGPAAGVVVAALVVGGVVTSTASGDDEAQQLPATDGPTPVSAAAALSARLESAARASRWPSLTPAPDELDKDDRADEWVEDGCLRMATVDELAEHCTYGDGPRTAVILGDSIAISYAPAIRRALGDGWTVRIMTAGQCPVADVPVRNGDGSAYERCPGFRDTTFEILHDEPVDLVFASESDDTTDRMAAGDDDAERLAILTEGWVASLEELTATGAEVVVLSAPPRGQPLADCATTLNAPTDCNVRVEPVHDGINEATRRAVAALDDPDALWVDADSWFCTAAGICPPFAGTAPVRADRMHLTDTYAESLGPVLRDAIARPRG